MSDEFWKRYCKLTIQKQSDNVEALDFSDFRIVFQVAQATVDAPKFAEIYIYNLSDETMNLLAGKDSENKGQIVILEAGYQGMHDIVFKGRVFQFRKGRDNPTDKYLCIIAQSGESASFSITNASLAAGANAQEERDIILSDLGMYGVESRYLNGIDSQEYPRGRVLFGQSTQLLNFVADKTASDIRIEDEQVVMIDKAGKTDDVAVILSPATGLIGMPELTQEGLRFESLLNPNIKFGSQVQIDMSLIQTQNFNISWGQQGIDQQQKSISTAAGKNGFYNVVSAEYRGDTRGDEWYVGGVAVGVGALPPLTGISITGVAE